MSKKVTIFTPTYNRAYVLDKLYNSLKIQTNQDFEWIIVDDGSEDNTKKLVDGFKNEGLVDIQYYYQKNAGKSQAHNLGVEKTNSELFVCVDSDDYLDGNAVQEVIEQWEKVCNQAPIGMVFKRRYSDNRPLTKMDKKLIYTFDTLYNATTSGMLAGDTCLIFRSDIIKVFSFPKYDNEKFVPESYLYDQLDQVGKLYFVDKCIYVTEYLEDGYTRNFDKVIFENPKGYLAYIEQRLTFDNSLKTICGDVIRYISVSLAIHEKWIYENKRALSVLLYPLGYGLYMKRFSKFR